MKSFLAALQLLKDSQAFVMFDDEFLRSREKKKRLSRFEKIVQRWEIMLCRCLFQFVFPILFLEPGSIKICLT